MNVGLVAALVFVAACVPSPQGDAGTEVLDAAVVDAGVVFDAGPTPVDAGSEYWDGGACADKRECPCFSSDDCAPTHVCHSEDDSGLAVFCIPGARGPGSAGATCRGQGDCASALCVDGANSAQVCSVLCASPADCPAVLPRCLFIGFGVDRSICAPP